MLWNKQQKKDILPKGITLHNKHRCKFLLFVNNQIKNQLNIHKNFIIIRESWIESELIINGGIFYIKWYSTDNYLRYSLQMAGLIC